MHCTRTWRIVTSLACALALSACEGKQGEQGPAGTNGTDGQNGAVGAAGATGPAGATGATGATGAAGTDGTSAPTTGTLAGTVTDGVKSDVLAGVTVTAKDLGGATVQTATTDATGSFSLSVPFGTLSLTFAKAHYTSPAPMVVGALAGRPVTLNVTLNEAATGKPSVTLAAAANNVGYGATVTVTATASDPDGDTLTYAWADGTAPKFTGVTVVANSPATSAVLTMPTMANAFAKRFDPADPAGFTSGYTIPDQFGVLPISADTRAPVSVKVTVSDGRGQSTAVSATVNAAPVLTGARNVAIGTRVYLNSGHGGTNAWTMGAKPTGSAAALDSTSSRTPSFVADKAGVYTLAENGNTMDVYAGDWKGIITGVGTSGPDSVATDTSCATCHNGTVAPNNFTAWKATGHATQFSMGIDGTKSPSYGASCVSCHAVGYDPAVANGGFDDVAATNTWTFPSVLASNNWTDLVTAKPAVARLANIQCENCHGPQTSDAHMLTNLPTASPAGVGLYKSPRVGYSAEVCATCHASGSGHHQYSEWNTVDPVTGWGHSNRGGAAKGLSGSKLNGHCGRCHTAQGFVAYVAQLKAGNIGNIGNIPSTAAVATDVGPQNVEPVTCTACHDPHDKANENQLRVAGDTGLLPGGFDGQGMGKGALCVTCHNSRNGAQTGSTTATYLHADGELYNSGNPTGYSAPHQACQGDVFTGNNAYFMGGSLPMASKHAAITDTCAGCHMTLNPKSHLSHGTPAHNQHEFRILSADLPTLCANCHSAAVSGEGIQASVEAGLVALATKMGNEAKTKINAAGIINVRAYDPVTDLYSSTSASNVAIDTSANPVLSVGIEEGHGQIEFHLRLTNPVTIQFVDSAGAAVGSPKSMTEFGVQLGSLKDNQTTPVALYPLSGNMVRAGWNYFLIEGDQSLGLHNPTFAQQVLNNTLAKNLTN